MAKKHNRFNFRYDESFMDEIDAWCSKQDKPPSRSEAIRFLALRGAAAERYLSVILEKSINDLITAGVFSDPSASEVYKRFQEVVTKSLDAAANLDQVRRQQENVPGLYVHPLDDSAPEKPLQGTSLPKLQQYSR